MDAVVECARKQFGISYLLPVQRLVIANILDPLRETEETTEERMHDWSRKQLVVLPTGTGKSLCFQLPPFFYTGITIVIYPLLSLMNDQLRRMKAVGLKPLVLRGGMSRQERAELRRSLYKEDRVILITNPEALHGSGIRSDLQSLRVEHFVVDEAHCVVQWGESFRPTYLLLHEIIQDCAPRVVTAFTATASPSIIRGIQTHLFNNEAFNTLVGNPDRPNIHYTVIPCLHTMISLLMMLQPCIQTDTERGLHENNKVPLSGSQGRNFKKNRHMLQILKGYTVPPVVLPCIIFCSTRRQAEKCAFMIRDTFCYDDVRYYHAHLTKEDKEAVESWFFASGNGILCATCAYGMGVDKANIRTVIHLESSTSPEAYVQESGRAGRDGQPARALLLWEIDDASYIRRLQNDVRTTPSGGAKKAAAVSEYSVSPQRTHDAALVRHKRTHPFFDTYSAQWQCRRVQLLEYLGARCEVCAGCDVCDNESYSIAGLEFLQAIVTTEKRTESQLVDRMLGNTKQSVWSLFAGFPEKSVEALFSRARTLHLIKQRGYLFGNTLSWKLQRPPKR